MFTDKGAVVEPYDSDQQGWQAGDIVTAVGGQSMETWIESLLVPGLSRPLWQIGDEVSYTIERDGRPKNHPN